MSEAVEPLVMTGEYRAVCLLLNACGTGPSEMCTSHVRRVEGARAAIVILRPRGRGLNVMRVVVSVRMCDVRWPRCCQKCHVVVYVEHAVSLLYFVEIARYDKV